MIQSFAIRFYFISDFCFAGLDRIMSLKQPHACLDFPITPLAVVVCHRVVHLHAPRRLQSRPACRPEKTAQGTIEASFQAIGWMYMQSALSRSAGPQIDAQLFRIGRRQSHQPQLPNQFFFFFLIPLQKNLFLPFYPPSPFLQLQCQGGAMPVPTDPTLRPRGRPLDDIQRFWLAGVTGCGWRGWKLRNSRRAATIHGGQARSIGSNAVIAANCSARRLLLGRRANSCLYLRYLGYLMYSDSYQFRSGLRLNSQSW